MEKQTDGAVTSTTSTSAGHKDPANKIHASDKLNCRKSTQKVDRAAGSSKGSFVRAEASAEKGTSCDIGGSCECFSGFPGIARSE